jgi:hypothetical protein
LSQAIGYDLQERAMFIPVPAIAAVIIVMLAYLGWSIALARGRNPLPFPDPGSRIFAASSPEAKNAVVELLERHGLPERFQVNTEQVRRSIFWDGTIINYSTPDVVVKLGSAAASIGMVSADPAASAESAAAFLREQGFSAAVVLDAEPDLPIAFVLTDALTGAALNFRKHVIHMPRPK